MQNRFNWIELIIAVLLFTACGKRENRFHNVVVDSLSSVKIERFDHAVFGLDECISKPAVAGNYDLLTVDIPDGDSLCLKEKIENLEEIYVQIVHE
mgnify:FL=1